MLNQGPVLSQSQLALSECSMAFWVMDILVYSHSKLGTDGVDSDNQRGTSKPQASV
jgi:hypothetical protein